jgi:hypothetical protein
MTEQQQSVINVTFATKLSTGNYENEEYRLSISQVVDPTLSQPELVQEAEELGRMVKAQAYTEAGVEWSHDDDGRVMRLLKSSVPEPSGRPKATAPAKAAAPRSAPSRPSTPPRKGRTNSEATALWVHLIEVDDPKSEYFDNRDRIESGAWSPKAPYFKHKKTDTKLFFGDCPEDIRNHFVDDSGAIIYDHVGSFAN